jgi:hypothetical protein
LGGANRTSSGNLPSGKTRGAAMSAGVEMVDKTRDSPSIEAKAFLVMAYRLPSPNRSSKEKTMQRKGGELIEFNSR